MYANEALPPVEPTQEKDSSDQPRNGSIDPNYKPSPKELALQKAKQKALKQFVKKQSLKDFQSTFEQLNNSADLSTSPPITFSDGDINTQDTATRSCYYCKDISVGVWKEPNNWAHRNYCGPASTQVALDARWPANWVPDIDAVGEAENIDPSWGVYMSDVVNALNNYLSDEFPNPNGMQGYWYGTASDTWDLYDKVYFDNYRDYVTISGVYTQGMPGWNVNAYHIVAIFGIYSDWTWTGYHYTETAGSVAGYYGDYRQWANVYAFYDWESANNAIAW